VSLLHFFLLAIDLQILLDDHRLSQAPDPSCRRLWGDIWLTCSTAGKTQGLRETPPPNVSSRAKRARTANDPGAANRPPQVFTILFVELLLYDANGRRNRGDGFSSACGGSGSVVAGDRATSGPRSRSGRENLFKLMQVGRLREVLIEPGLERPLYVFGKA
jgi:hypothetical protein